jgi:transcriptional regulator with GAF, ATPase, and Fis domain
MSEHAEPLSERMAEAARELQDHQSDPQATMDAAVKLAALNIEGCDAVGISFVQAKRRIETVASTDDLVVHADRLQYETEEGPCLDAIWEQQTIHSPSLGYDHRWPIWGPRVVEETQAQSVLAFQLFTHEDTLGALNVYSRTRDAFDESAREDGLAIAAHIAIAVAAARRIGQLGTALDTRTVIGQATGFIMGRFDLDAPTAFNVLARLASQSNTKLRDVADQIVTSRELPGP